MFSFVLPFALALGMACGRHPTPSQDISELYFPMSSFLAAQAQVLGKRGHAFDKKALFDGDSSQHIVQYDSTGWRRALKAWTALDLNKSRLRRQYLVDTTYHVSQNPLQRIIRYTPRKDATHTVQELIIHEDSLGQVRAIRGMLEEDKYLYRSTRKLHAAFSSQGILQRYSLWGHQRMLFSDTVHYRITFQQRP